MKIPLRVGVEMSGNGQNNLADQVLPNLFQQKKSSKKSLSSFKIPEFENLDSSICRFLYPGFYCTQPEFGSVPVRICSTHESYPQYL